MSALSSSMSIRASWATPFSGQVVSIRASSSFLVMLVMILWFCVSWVQLRMMIPRADGTFCTRSPGNHMHGLDSAGPVQEKHAQNP